jgi:hypothetical protein
LHCIAALFFLIECVISPVLFCLFPLGELIRISASCSWFSHREDNEGFDVDDADELLYTTTTDVWNAEGNKTDSSSDRPDYTPHERSFDDVAEVGQLWATHNKTGDCCSHTFNAIHSHTYLHTYMPISSLLFITAVYLIFDLPFIHEEHTGNHFSSASLNVFKLHDGVEWHQGAQVRMK